MLTNREPTQARPLNQIELGHILNSFLNGFLLFVLTTYILKKKLFMVHDILSLPVELRPHMSHVSTEHIGELVRLQLPALLRDPGVLNCHHGLRHLRGQQCHYSVRSLKVCRIVLISRRRIKISQDSNIDYFIRVHGRVSGCMRAQPHLERQDENDTSVVDVVGINQG